MKDQHTYEYESYGWTFERSYEYDNHSRLMQELNKLGQEGWQIVTATKEMFHGRPGFKFDCIMMREVRP